MHKLPASITHSINLFWLRSYFECFGEKISIVFFSKLEKTWVIYVQYFDQSNAQQTFTNTLMVCNSLPILWWRYHSQKEITFLSHNCDFQQREITLFKWVAMWPHRHPLGVPQVWILQPHDSLWPFLQPLYSRLRAWYSNGWYS